MNENLKKVSQTLSDREKIAGIVWLVIGILQCLSVVFIIAGVWNIYAATTRFKQSKMVLTPWTGIVYTYDKWLSRVIVGLVCNLIAGLIVGGLIGVVGSIYDLVAVRGYVMKNKQVYADAGL